MRIRLSAAFLFLCCCLVTTGPAQNGNDPLTKKVDQLFATWDKPESPGAAIAVIKDGAVVYKRGYGSANLDHDATQSGQAPGAGDSADVLPESRASRLVRCCGNVPGLIEHCWRR